MNKEPELIDFIDDWVVGYKGHLARINNLEHWKKGGHEKAYKKIETKLKKGDKNGTNT